MLSENAAYDQIKLNAIPRWNYTVRNSTPPHEIQQYTKTLNTDRTKAQIHTEQYFQGISLKSAQ
jgi:hypothetical protein